MNGYTACTALPVPGAPRFLAAGKGFGQILSEYEVPENLEIANGGDWQAAAACPTGWLLGGSEFLVVCNGQTRRFPSTVGVISCLCRFRDRWVGGTKEGTLFVLSEGQPLSCFQAEEAILAVCAGDTCCLAVTKNGWILLSEDGCRWDASNFNQMYDGYMPVCQFSAAAWGGGRFLLAGESEGKPILLSSAGGATWGACSLAAHDEFGQLKAPGTEKLLGLCWSEAAGQTFAATDSGFLYVLPSCPRCVKREPIFLREISCCAESGGTLLLAGRNGEFLFLSTLSYRQTRMALRQAKLEQKNGALLIDVRAFEDAGRDPVSEAIPVPLEQLAERLPQLAQPTQVLLFLCDFGNLADTAVQIAVKLGYTNCYNVGSAYAWKRFR